ncbi:hypothetical protein RB195_001495 [Necator americanus]|uniref:Uncharacterized protein n=1 Tax=Necator americanus TaxID=51031 RepID=A0ABR1DEJ6_NECAM
MRFALLASFLILSSCAQDEDDRDKDRNGQLIDDISDDDFLFEDDDFRGELEDVEVPSNQYGASIGGHRKFWGQKAGTNQFPEKRKKMGWKAMKNFRRFYKKAPGASIGGYRKFWGQKAGTNQFPEKRKKMGWKAMKNVRKFYKKAAKSRSRRGRRSLPMYRRYPRKKVATMNARNTGEGDRFTYFKRMNSYKDAVPYAQFSHQRSRTNRRPWKSLSLKKKPNLNQKGTETRLDGNRFLATITEKPKTVKSIMATAGKIQKNSTEKSHSQSSKSEKNSLPSKSSSKNENSGGNSPAIARKDKGTTGKFLSKPKVQDVSGEKQKHKN